nr:MAG TPA: minor capsid protein [Caudoviricetes sp.]
MQRRMENSIRKQKRRAIAFEKAGLKNDAQAASIKARRLTQKYKDFSKAAKLPEQRARMEVYKKG